MFGLGMSEMLIIGLVILIFVNPKDLPKFVYHVGKIYGQLMESYQSMTRQIRDLGDEARREIEKAKYAAENTLKENATPAALTPDTPAEVPTPSAAPTAPTTKRAKPAKKPVNKGKPSAAKKSVRKKK